MTDDARSTRFPPRKQALEAAAAIAGGDPLLPASDRAARQAVARLVPYGILERAMELAVEQQRARHGVALVDPMRHVRCAVSLLFAAAAGDGAAPEALYRMRKSARAFPLARRCPLHITPPRRATI